MKRATTIFCLGILTVAANCGGGQTGEVGAPNCDNIGGDNLFDFAAATPLGFSGDEVLASIPSPQTASLTWDGGAVSALTIELSPDPTQMVNHVIPADFDSPECDERIEVPVTLRLTTTDGALAEDVQLELVAATTTEATAQQLIDAVQFAGTVDLMSYAEPDSWDESQARILLDATFEPGGSSGTLALSTHRETGGATEDKLVASW